MIGSVIGGYIGALSRGACENSECSKRNRNDVYVGIAAGGAAGALLGFGVSHVPKRGRSNSEVRSATISTIRLTHVATDGRSQHCGWSHGPICESSGSMRILRRPPAAELGR